MFLLNMYRYVLTINHVTYEFIELFVQGCWIIAKCLKKPVLLFYSNISYTVLSPS